MEWTTLADENGYRRLGDDYQDLLARYAAMVRVPGFRPGKVPRGAVEQRFRTEIMADLADRAVRGLGRKAAREAGVEALGSVEASEIECQSGKRFRARLRYLPIPELSLPELTSLHTEDDGTDVKDRISRRLLELVRFEIPAELTRAELGMDGLDGSEPGSDEWVAAAERIRLIVVLKTIARREGIEVDEADVDRRIAEKAEAFDTTKRALQDEIEKGGGRGRLQDMVLAERTLEYLIEINAQ
jgi:FKBP-type peptidyl-prolyl cis-trans isomerase (trigger factor)